MRKRKPDNGCVHKICDAVAVRLPDGETFAILCNGYDGCPHVHVSEASAAYVNNSPLWSKYFNVEAESVENALHDLERRAHDLTSAQVAHFLRGQFRDTK